MVCGAVTAPASAQDEDEILHARVLMDTTLTLGTYDEATAFAAADHWGYIDSADTAFAAGTAGSLGDADFLWRGVEYTVIALAVEGTSGAVSSVVIDIEDAAGIDLPATASIGVELTSGGGAAYLLPWPEYSTNHSELTGRSEAVLGDWRTTATGTRLAVRILDLDAPDLWNADLGFTAMGGFVTAVGYGLGPGSRDLAAHGTLQPTTFEFDGVAYTVDRLLMRTPNSAKSLELWFRTTPHLASSAGYRLALPLSVNGKGLVYQYALDAGDFSQPGEVQPDGDYVWDVEDGVAAEAADFIYPDGTRKVYLTRSPGDTESARPFWSATLTPETQDAAAAGYAPGDLGRVFGGATTVTVNASTADVTGTDAATAGTDYTALPTGTTATVRFADFAAVGAGGSAGLALPGPAALPAVQTTADMTADNNETFEVLLALPSATDARMRLDPAKATVRIVEGPPDETLRICGADGQCVNQAGALCQASDTLCVGGTMAAVLVEAVPAARACGRPAGVRPIALRRCRAGRGDLVRRCGVFRQRSDARGLSAQRGRTQLLAAAHRGCRDPLPRGRHGGADGAGEPVVADGAGGRHGALLGVAHQAAGP